MIKVNKNKLNVCGIEFGMPDNFGIDTEGMDCIREDSLRFMSSEGDCSISIITNDAGYDSSLASLMDIFDDADDMYTDNDTGYKWISEPAESTENGLTYASIKYETKHDFYYEVHFERIKIFDSQLEVLLTVPKECGVDLDTVLERENVQEFFKSFSKIQ